MMQHDLNFLIETTTKHRLGPKLEISPRTHGSKHSSLGFEWESQQSEQGQERSVLTMDFEVSKYK